MATELRPDIQSAKDRISTRMGAGREFKKREVVRAILAGHTAPVASAPPAFAAAPPPPPPPPTVPAGWYPDAQNPTLQRYWDGVGWTEHTAPLA